jgi:hypothetical protein
MIGFEIAYVDGSTEQGPARSWPSVRSDGIASVSVGGAQGRTRYQGHSLYWLRAEGQDWVVGGASFYVNPISEIVIAPDGSMIERKLEWVPDMFHRDVKLGWWDG